MKKKDFSTIALIIVFFVGVSVLLYPTVSDYWNSLHQSQAIATYADSVENMDEQDYEKLWDAAVSYNQKLFQSGHGLGLKDEEKEEYNKLLDVSGTGIMSYIEIPKIKCSLPVYHGTDEGVLQIAVGHIEGSSLPVGGLNTHCVLSGHRGLPSAKLFSNLDKLEEGDIFMIRTLDQTLTYEVDQIRIVLPDEVENLKIEEGKDLCTLVTCTPYGINTHRLLVRGHRVANQEEAEVVRVTADAMLVDNRIVAMCIAVPVLVLLLIYVAFGGRRRKR
ncbi:class C sortase [Blautia sp. HCP3S3_C4]|uniref:class C sortase n=1 Tax=Blautia sp. HCP3S3_C4 TaxID=3438911 RepID=UPI003F89CA8A